MIPEYESDEDSNLDEETGEASEESGNVGSSLIVSAVHTASESDSNDGSTHECPILISSDDGD